jgi:hypothetical protein
MRPCRQRRTFLWRPVAPQPPRRRRSTGGPQPGHPAPHRRPTRCPRWPGSSLPAGSRRGHGHDRPDGGVASRGCSLRMDRRLGLARRRVANADQAVSGQKPWFQNRRSKEIPSIGASPAFMGHDAERSITVR